MRIRVAFALAFLAAPASAQDLPSSLDDLTDASSIASAAQTLVEQAEDRILVRDMLGKEIKGSDGETIGTVENLAVVPGGRIVAAIVDTGQDSRIALPFAAVKLAGSASALEVPVPASELTGMSALRSLADSLAE